MKLPEPKRFVIRHEVYDEARDDLAIETHHIEADIIEGINPGVIALSHSETGATLLVDSDFFQAGWTEGVE